MACTCTPWLCTSRTTSRASRPAPITPQRSFAVGVEFCVSVMLKRYLLWLVVSLKNLVGAHAHVAIERRINHGPHPNQSYQDCRDQEDKQELPKIEHMQCNANNEQVEECQRYKNCSSPRLNVDPRQRHTRFALESLCNVFCLAVTGAASQRSA